MLKERIDTLRTEARGKVPIIYDVLTMVKAGIEKEEKIDGKLANDIIVEKVIRREIKQLNETLDIVQKAAGPDIIVINTCYMKIKYLESLVPKLMDEDEIRTVVSQAIVDLGFTVEGIKKSDIGKIKGKIMPSLKGKADGNLVSKVIDEYVNGVI
jgi:uncharacterized protein YqeY